MPNLVESLFLIAFWLPPLAVVAGAALLAWPTADRTHRVAGTSRPNQVDRSHATAA